MICMSWYSMVGMYNECAFLWVKNTYATCAVALRHLSCSCRLSLMLMYGCISHQRSLECWFKAMQSWWWIGVSFGKGGESDHIICIRLYIVVTSCLSVTFRMLLMQLTEQPADSSCFWRTEGVIWIGPTQMPLGQRWACCRHFITCL